MLDEKLHLPRSAILVIASCVFLTFDSLMTSWQEHPCYAQAMIGYDSVINARLGVPAEHALDLSVDLQQRLSNQYIYSTELLNIILTAYLWDNSPYDYSRRVFYHCTLRHRTHNDANDMAG